MPECRILHLVVVVALVLHIALESSQGDRGIEFGQPLDKNPLLMKFVPDFSQDRFLPGYTNFCTFSNFGMAVAPQPPALYTKGKCAFGTCKLRKSLAEILQLRTIG